MVKSALMSALMSAVSDGWGACTAKTTMMYVM